MKTIKRSVKTRKQMRKEKALSNSESGRNTPTFFTVGGRAIDGDMGTHCQAPKSFKHCRNNMSRMNATS